MKPNPIPFADLDTETLLIEAHSGLMRIPSAARSITILETLITRNRNEGLDRDRSPWIDATTNLPDDDTTVLICNPEWDGDPVSLGFHDGDCGWCDPDGMSFSNSRGTPQPTHWMHLPDPATFDLRPESEAQS